MTGPLGSFESTVMADENMERKLSCTACDKTPFHPGEVKYEVLGC